MNIPIGFNIERKQADDARFKKWGIIIVGAEIVVAVILAVVLKMVWE